MLFGFDIDIDVMAPLNDNKIREAHMVFCRDPPKPKTLLDCPSRCCKSDASRKKCSGASATQFTCLSLYFQARRRGGPMGGKAMAGGGFPKWQWEHVMKRAPLSLSRPHPSFASPWNNLPQVDDGLQDQACSAAGWLLFSCCCS